MVIGDRKEHDVCLLPLEAVHGAELDDAGWSCGIAHYKGVMGPTLSGLVPQPVAEQPLLSAIEGQNCNLPRFAVRESITARVRIGLSPCNELAALKDHGVCFILALATLTGAGDMQPPRTRL